MMENHGTRPGNIDNGKVAVIEKDYTSVHDKEKGNNKI